MRTISPDAPEQLIKPQKCPHLHDQKVFFVWIIQLFQRSLQYSFVESLRAEHGLYIVSKPRTEFLHHRVLSLLA